MLVDFSFENHIDSLQIFQKMMQWLFETYCSNFISK